MAAALCLLLWGHDSTLISNTLKKRDALTTCFYFRFFFTCDFVVILRFTSDRKAHQKDSAAIGCIRHLCLDRPYSLLRCLIVVIGIRSCRCSIQGQEQEL